MSGSAAALVARARPDGHTIHVDVFIAQRENGQPIIGYGLYPATPSDAAALPTAPAIVVTPPVAAIRRIT